MQLNAIAPAIELACPLIFRDFPAANVASAEFHITGLGLYVAFLNGARVGDCYLSPGFNDYQAYLRYQTYDVTHLLQQDNKLEVLLGNGWYRGRFGLNGGRENTFGSQPMLAAKLIITHADGTVTVLETDESWHATASNILHNGIYDGESRDDTALASTIIACVPVELPCEPIPDFSPPIRCKHTLHASLIVSPTGQQILDFGQNHTGVVRFINRLPRGEKLTLQFGEILQDGCFYRDNLRSATAAYEFISDGIEKPIEPYFTFFGFRYVIVEGLKAVDPADFAALVLYSDLEQTIEAETDSAAINRLLANALWSQRSNFLDIPTDCPQRDERLGWTGDAQVFAVTACYQMQCKAFYQKYLFDLRMDQTRYYHGDIPMFIPSLSGAADAGGAVWADAAAIIPWTVYRFYGDLEQLRQAYPMIQDYVETLIEKDRLCGDRRLLLSGFTFGDWLALDGVNEQAFKGGTDDGYIQSIYYWNSIHLCALAAAELERHDDAARYAIFAEEIREAIQNEFFSASGRLCIDTQTGYVLALHFGIYRDRDVLISGFRSRLKRDAYRIKTGFCGAPLLLPALFQSGMADEAFRFLYNESFPGWLYCVNLGATTIWERWNSVSADSTISGTGMNSLNHYAYGSVAEAIYAHIAGLQCGTHGWKSAIIAPQINYRMRSIRVAYDSIVGRYEIAWYVAKNGSVTLEVKIPAGGRAHIIPPYHPQNQTFDSGPCTFAITYMPTIDLLHPWSAKTMLSDLLADNAAATVLRTHLPALYQAVSGQESALRYDKLEDTIHMLPFVEKTCLPEIDALLRQIAIE